jgi:hypothetical protein
MPRPPFAPTRERRHLVMALRSVGAPVEVIARLLDEHDGDNVKTLRRHFGAGTVGSARVPPVDADLP